MQTLVIRFGVFGKSLGTRQIAGTFRSTIKKKLKEGRDLAFDMDGLRSLSDAFADECFGKLAMEFGMPFIKQYTTIRNAEPRVSASIQQAFRDVERKQSA